MMLLLLAIGCIAPPTDAWYLTISEWEGPAPAAEAEFIYSDGAGFSQGTGIIDTDGNVIDVGESVNIAPDGDLVRFGVEQWEWSTDRGQTWEDVTPNLGDLTWNSLIVGTGRLLLYAETEVGSGDFSFQLSNSKGGAWQSGNVRLPAGSRPYQFTDDRGFALDPDSDPDQPSIYTFGLPGGTAKRIVSQRDYRTSMPSEFLPDGTPYGRQANTVSLEWYGYELLNLTMMPGWKPSMSSVDFDQVRVIGGAPTTQVRAVDEEGHVWLDDGETIWRSDNALRKNPGELNKRLVGPRCRQKLWPDVDPHLEDEEVEGSNATVVQNDSDKAFYARYSAWDWLPGHEGTIEPGQSLTVEGDVGDILYIETTDGYCYGFWLIEDNNAHITVNTP